MSLRTDLTTGALDSTIAAGASKTTYAGAGISVGGWLVSSEAAVLVGMAIGVAGLIVNWYYRARDDRRAQAEHEARMRQIQHPPRG